jgi:hypothetical protein
VYIIGFLSASGGNIVNMAKKILLPLFISSIVMPMDMVPIQSKWHLLAKDIVVGVANEIDLYSCDQLKQSCKHFLALLILIIIKPELFTF